MVGNTHDLNSAEEQQKHLDGENHEAGGMFGSLRKKLRDSKLHDVKVYINVGMSPREHDSRLTRRWIRLAQST